MQIISESLATTCVPDPWKLWVVFLHGLRPRTSRTASVAFEGKNQALPTHVAKAFLSKSCYSHLHIILCLPYIPHHLHQQAGTFDRCCSFHSSSLDSGSYINPVRILYKNSKISSLQQLTQFIFCVCVYICVYIYTHICVCVVTSVHTYVRTYVHTYIHTYIRSDFFFIAILLFDAV